MKFSPQLLMAVLATTVSATPLIFQRDYNSISVVVTNVQSKIDVVDVAINKDDSQGVISSGQVLISTIQSGTVEVKKSDELSLADAAKLLGPVGELKKHGQTFHDDLVAKLKRIEELKMCDKARELLGQFQSSARELIDAMLSKCPEASRQIAAGQAKEITDLIDDVVNKFGQGKCNNA
ncbi:hypothetical protein CP533_5297 [Ophiocordyceps camponoti-saundersi (nom. inval.)]|nr:hypothetical protein CP533_5297 [Ophiocordyceps camponoti-saundersi (nom. inval.)]